MFKKILVANRGEIAVRIIRACFEMGIKTVAVFSEADREALHVKMADEAVCIGYSPAKDSYLNMENIISAAVLTGACSIHPGYGFLAENARFASLCENFGVKFIGPCCSAIEAMGNKANARKLVKAAGIPVICGSDGTVDSLEEAVKLALEMGYPVKLKAAMGGGGRGIRRCDNEEELCKGFEASKKEARAAFGDDSLYMEKVIEGARHIEVQVIGDDHGNIIHLGERECSLQIRNQKVLEEAPSVAICDDLRLKLGEVAVLAARACGYKNAGTMEFLLDANGKNFYFLEMNTRIQVEHPVTEMITGFDIVKEQISIAFGNRLSISQKDVRFDGHAVECRINAAAAGVVSRLVWPYNSCDSNDNGIRVDAGIYEGFAVPPYYDPLVMKIITYAATRAEAIAKMRSALDELVIDGIETNIGYHKLILENEGFVKGDYYIGMPVEAGAPIARLRISAREMIGNVVDSDSFLEMYEDMLPKNPIGFPDYEDKIKKLGESLDVKEAVVVGRALICGFKIIICAMDSRFIMGSMGSVAGEKIARAFETALAERLPIVIFTASGGARMQEGIVSLMQMAKVSAAVGRHSGAGLLYVAVLTDPTTGGVTASFAMQADIILAEPAATVGFAGRRVIEQTIKEKLPDDFQSAESALKHGFIDKIVARKDMRETLGRILGIHYGCL